MAAGKFRLGPNRYVLQSSIGRTVGGNVGPQGPRTTDHLRTTRNPKFSYRVTKNGTVPRNFNPMAPGKPLKRI